MWDKLKRDHPHLYDALEVLVLLMSVAIFFMALDVYLHVRGWL